MQYFKLCTLLLLVVLFTHCKNKNAHPEEVSTTLRFEERSFNKQSSTCSTDTVRCVRIEVTYPVATQGTPEAIKAMNDTIAQYITNTIANMSEAESPNSMEAAAADFIQLYEEYTKEDSAFITAWEIQTNGKVMYQAEKRVSIEISNYSYAGGAHPNSYVNLLTFDAKTGKKLAITDLVSDTAKLKELAEVKFREARELTPDANLKEEGYFWDGSFELASNIAATREGLYFVYNPYEAAAYALGPTEFTISYEALKGILKEDQD